MDHHACCGIDLEVTYRMKILFICMGNICRSPTAEGVFRKKIIDASLDRQVSIDSAGTHNYHSGEPPDARSLAHAKARGYDLSTLRARGLRDTDFVEFDWLIVMDDLNYSTVLHRTPDQHRAKVRRMMEFAADSVAREVPDPYYGERADFERVLDLVEAASDGLVDAVRLRLGVG
jgi:protein-tyrosine phosphatase